MCINAAETWTEHPSVPTFLMVSVLLHRRRKACQNGLRYTDPSWSRRGKRDTRKRWGEREREQSRRVQMSDQAAGSKGKGKKKENKQRLP
jgi:hypothetical protein